MPILHREACSMETDQYLRHCFLSAQTRQGRSLSLPTLPYQKTNRYAVVGDIAIHSLSNLVQKASVLILDTRIIVSSCILILLKTYGILSRSHFIIYEFEIRNNL